MNGYAFVLDDPAPDPGPGSLTVRLLGPSGAPVPDYTVVQEKPLHLILVREDLAGFAHVHPDRRADGSWTVAVDLSVGRWRAYADFQPTALGSEITLSTPLTVRGSATPEPRPVQRTTTTTDGYTITAIADPVSGQHTPFMISISRDGRPVTDLEPYLGAPAHLVIIRYHDMAYLHAHGGAATSGAGVESVATFDTNGTYAMFDEFAHGGVVHRAALVWVVR